MRRPRPRQSRLRGVVTIGALVVALLPLGAAPAAAVGSYSVEMIHAVPEGTTATPDIAERAAATMDAVQDFLAADLGRTLRVTPGVTFFEVAASGSASDMRDEMTAAGFDDRDTIYLVFADSPGEIGACGVTFPEATLATFSFVLMPACTIYPGYAPQTFPANATYLVLHELLHALGASQPCAPNSSLDGHVTDSERDVLYTGPLVRDWYNLTVDVGHDDYYGHSIAGCIDVEDSGYWADAPTSECNGLRVTIDMNLGSRGQGTDGPDVILGTAGADVINAHGGDDVVCAGAGADRVTTGDGADVVFGEGGSDRIWSEAGDDYVDAGSGADRVWAGAGDDTIFGRGGQDRLYGETGSDIIQGNWESDIIEGGSANDSLFGAAGKDKLYGNDGNDTLAGGDNTDFLDGGAGFDVANGQRGKDNPFVPDVSGCAAESVTSC